MRAIRKAVDLGLPIIGVVLVLAAVIFFFQNLYLQIAIVLVGLVLIEAGIWNLASPILPSERKYIALRNEVDDFIKLVRRLNKATLELAGDPQPHNRARLLQVRDEMLHSVRRMETYAGREDVQPGTPLDAVEDGADPGNAGAATAPRGDTTGAP